ncbi:MAG: 2-oxo acid dehydrogenase subunit E2 [Acidobacteria bacterium]|nr:2-oxo acid dehydrogenase subunit E2 [Acidobacteriota bacterium]
MAFEFKLPDIGEGVVEGEIVHWLVKEGDRVEEDQPLVEVMTDKATVEIHSPRAGIIVRRAGEEGQTVAVGSTLVVIGERGETPAAPAPAAAVTSRDGGVSGNESAASAGEAPAGGPRPSARGGAGGDRVRKQATPATRRVAREMGIDLAQVAGSGPEGRITRQDLEAFSRGAGTAGAVPAVPAAAEERVPLRGVRKRIAEKMARSQHTAAHYGFVEEIDVTSLVQLRNQAEPLAQSRGLKITYLPFIIKAAVAGLQKHPLMNAALDEERQEILVKKRYNIGVAVATEQGLVVPVVKGADGMSIWEISAEVQRLSEDARRSRSRLEDLQDSTFTITSLGTLGGISATPIINYPEVAIMGVHRIRVLPRFVEGTFQPRHMMNISLSIDHRVVDGIVGAQFAAEVKRLLESPALLCL